MAAVVVGAGLAGLVAACEIADAGIPVTLVEQEGRQSLGGQAYWSFGGLFLVDTPEQRRCGVRDSLELAWQDWQGTAGFDRAEDHWPRAWAEAFCGFAAGELRSWLHGQGVRWFPVPGWAERGDGRAEGHGNSVPRFHIVWGTDPGLVEPFAARWAAHVAAGRGREAYRHRVEELVRTGGRVTGVRCSVLEPSRVARGEPSNRTVVEEVVIDADAVVVASGGIGGDHELVRRAWPQRLGPPPTRMVSGVPAHVDGRMLAITERAGGRVINTDRMWHYTEGLHNHSPVWENHGIRILPGPSSLWLDALGRRLPPPYLPGFDTLGTLAHLRATGHDHSWFVLTRRIVEKEFTLSGSEQNPDLTGRDLRLLARRLAPGPTAPVEAFLRDGEDFVVADTVAELVAGMNRVAGEALLDADAVEQTIRARDRELDHDFTKDAQITAIRGARRYVGDRLLRVATPHRLLDPAAGPLIAVRLSVLTRKTLGGLETDLGGRALGGDGRVVPGVWAAGEAAGFGGGGMHGYRSLEGTFLAGCLFSGRTAGRDIAARLG